MGLWDALRSWFVAAPPPEAPPAPDPVSQIDPPSPTLEPPEDELPEEDSSEEVPARTWVRNRELEAVIAADPEAVGPYLVYADWLTEQGEPWGELIALQVALEQAGDRAALELSREHLRRVTIAVGHVGEGRGLRVGG